MALKILNNYKFSNLYLHNLRLSQKKRFRVFLFNIVISHIRKMS